MAWWQLCRAFHTKRNFLKKHAKLTEPYSTPDTLSATLLPISLVLFPILYMSWWGSTWNQHEVTLKDAYPHTHVYSEYYQHMKQNIYFTFDPKHDSNQVYILNFSNNYPNLTLYQYYDVARQSEGVSNHWECRDHISQNPKIQSMNNPDNNNIVSGTLCYNRNNGQGLVLCRENNDFRDYLIDISYHQLENQRNSGDYLTTLDKEEGLLWAPNTSITITLQLWSLYESGLSLSPFWSGNQLDSTNIEFKDDTVRIPLVEAGEKCYGIRLLMHRVVYEAQDAFSLVVFITVLFSIIGALYSFLLLSCNGFAKCINLIIYICCRSFYEKEQKLEENNEQQINEMQMNTM
eukprot:152473_1